MSLIDDALKKTQSALNPNQAQYKPPLDKEIPTSSFRTPPIPEHIRFLTKKKREVRAFVLNRWTIGIPAFLFLSLFVMFAHTFFLHLAQRYTRFYSQLIHEVSTSKVEKPIVVAAPIPVINFELDGTLQMNGEHVALINHALYHIGEVIDGFQIKSVHYNSVTLVNLKTHQKEVLTPELVH